MDKGPDAEENASEHDGDREEQRKRRKEKHKMKLLREIAKSEKRGVCYLSRIPPHLKPLKLRHLLAEYGEVLRIYLAPEDPGIRIRRKMAGKDSGKHFTEGWVEFADKAVAKRVSKMLNGEPMGKDNINLCLKLIEPDTNLFMRDLTEAKRSAYFYDLWNIKYLKKFKWDNLTEEIAYRNAVREQKQAVNISAAKRECDFYLAKVDQSKAIAAMEERKKKKPRLGELSASSKEPEHQTITETTKVMLHFIQKKSVTAGRDTTPRLSSHSICDNQ